MAKPRIFNEETAHVEEATQEATDASNGEAKGGWEPGATSDDYAPHPGRRHVYKGGDTCIRCGESKAAKGNTARGGGTPRTSRRSSGTIEMLLSLAWLGVGYGIERQPFLLTDRVDGEGNPIKDADTPGVAPKDAIAATWKMESAVAGHRLDRALRHTAIYKVVAPFLDTAGAYADIGMLFAPPMLVGLAAMRPDIAREPTVRGIMLGALIPILTEQAKMAEAQAELLGKLEGVTAETMEAANNILDTLLGVKPGEQHSTS